MSIILDALRGGRWKPAPQRQPHASQTDAVLQTLGYRRFRPASSANRLKRVFAYLIAGLAGGVLLWFAVVWITQAFLTTDLTRPNPAPASARSSPPAPVPRRAENVPSAAPAPVISPVAPVPGPAPIPAPSLGARSGAGGTTAPSRSGTTVPTSNSPTRAIIRSGEDHFGKALHYQRIGDFDNALFYYKQLLQRDELNAEAHNNLGLLYRDKELLSDAVNEFKRATAIDPRNPRPRNNLGVVYLSQGKLDAAAAEFQAALAIDPKNTESLVNLSIVQKESGRRDGARRALVSALEIDPDNAEAHYNFGLLEDEAGNRAEAIAHYRVFLQRGAGALVGDVRKRVQKLEGEK